MNSNRRAALAAMMTCLLGNFGTLAYAGDKHLAKKQFELTGAAVKSIDVMDVVQQQPLMLLPQSNVIQSPAAAASMATSNAALAQNSLREATGKLEDAFKRKNSSLSKEFTRQLIEALQAKSFDAKVLRGHKLKKNAIGTQMELGPVKTSADAVLYAVLRFAGYKEDSAGLLPMVGVDVYLFEAKTGKLLYRQVFNQGYPLIQSPEVESLPVSTQAKFKGRNTLVSNADSAADVLVQVLAPVAGRIAEQLAK